MEASRAQAIREIARAVLRQLYRRRFEIWPDPPASPFEIIEPSFALWLEGILYKEVPQIYDFVEGSSGKPRYQQLAGIFDPAARTVSVASNFGEEIRRYSAAHELAHLILHTAEGQERRLFRDPPVSEIERTRKRRPEIEREADLFAAEFLMPSKLLKAVFRQYFGRETLAGVPLDEEIVAWLSRRVLPRQQFTVQQLRAMSSRNLAGLLARSRPWDTSSDSLTLCARFRVSDIAMAIQLEDLKLAFTKAAPPATSLRPGKPARPPRPRDRRSSSEPALRPSKPPAQALQSASPPRLPRQPTEMGGGPPPAEGAPEFHVLLSYDHRDWPEVKEIAQSLRRRGIRPWVDKWYLRPGTRWQDTLANLAEQIPTMIIFIGPHEGEKTFQDLERENFLETFKDKERPIIPVILPSFPENRNPKLPGLLKPFAPVDFRQSDLDPLDQLIFGITGRNPLLEEE